MSKQAVVEVSASIDPKEELRSAVFDKPLDTETVEWDKRKWEVRQPTLEIRDKWLALMDTEQVGTTEDGQAMAKIKGSLSEASVWLTITCTFQPGTDERVFNGKDTPRLMATGGEFVKKMAAAAIRMMKDAEVAAKNSDAIRTSK